MPLSAAQICNLARENARCPGFSSQSGQLLNSILSDLCQSYNFAVAKQTFNFNFNAAQINFNNQAYQNFPQNFLRSIRYESFYTISGVPYPMIQCELEEFDMLVEQAGLANFPVFYATDMSLTGVTNSPTGSGGLAVPVALFWQVPSGAYPVTVRYYSQMPDITTPESSNVVPWFPNQNYLIRELSGRLCQLTDDDRADAFLSADEERYPQGSGVILRRYLQMKDDAATIAKQVQLDRRRFGASFDRLRSTKTIGWMVPFTITLDGDILHRLLDGAVQWVAHLNTIPMLS